MDEVFLANGRVERDETDPNLIWKTVLTPGRLELTPGPGGRRQEKPLIVVEGNSPDPSKIIGLQDLFDAYEDGAFRHVTIPLSHENKLLENTGFAKKVRFTEENGKKVLQAAFLFTEPDIRDKVERGTIADVSCGILKNHIRQRDGKMYASAIEHIALTNKPWVDDMGSFTKLSDDDEEINSYCFSDQVEDEELNLSLRDNSDIVKKAWIKRHANHHFMVSQEAGSVRKTAGGFQAHHFASGHKSLHPSAEEAQNAVEAAHTLHTASSIPDPSKMTPRELSDQYENFRASQPGDLPSEKGNPVKKAAAKRTGSTKYLGRQPTAEEVARIRAPKKKKKAESPQGESKDNWSDTSSKDALLLASARRRGESIDLAAIGNEHSGQQMFDYVAKGMVDMTNNSGTRIVWDDRNSMVVRQHDLEDTLDQDFPGVMLLDFTPSKALVNDENGQYWIAGYSVDDNGDAEFHPQAEWTAFTPETEDN